MNLCYIERIREIFTTEVVVYLNQNSVFTEKWKFSVDAFKKNCEITTCYCLEKKHACFSGRYENISMF